MNILFKVKFWAAAVILILVVAACSDIAKPQITPEWDRSGQPLQITIYTYDTEKAMTQAIEYRLGRKLEQSVHGYAIMSPNDNICEVFVVAPKRVDDKNTLTLGHEIGHCLFGRYHSE